MRFLPSKQRLVAKCTSLSAWELPKEPSALAPEYVFSNRDMDPVGPEDQTWSVWTWMAYWATECISLGTWQTGGSMLSSGLSWREAIPAVVLGSACTSVPMVLNGAIGADLHVPFSVIVRSSFGYYFGYFCVISRAVLAMFWLGTVTTNGSTAVTVMIQAIWPSYARISNHIESNMGITTQGMISFLIFWIIQLPLLLIPPQKLRPLFLLKLIITPAAALATMGWCVNQAGGAGPIFAAKATLTGSTKAWKFLSCMSSVSGGLSTLACNIPDFSRYAKSNKGQYVQLPFIPIIYTLGTLVGIIGTSATAVIYGELIWNPLNIYIRWIETGSSGGRAAAFFCGVAWAVSQMCTNITANSISAANDLTVLFPRYLNIKRGCIMAAFIGAWVFVPWRIMASATNFLTFMGGYAIFLAPIAGIICSDYWIVKKRKINIPALYDPHGRYRYWYGVNWHAMVAFLVSLGPNLPGLVNAVGSTTNGSHIHVTEGAKHLYSFDWLFGFLMSVFVYTALSLIFPHQDVQVDETIRTIEVIHSKLGVDAEGEKARSLVTTSLESKSLN
ncbi:permease for cytosine/purines, uracil, thiamine, allantoin-domain-containing protein [Hypoxylon rubiginosum]|uniref:Permease for cytosine/purines, uracil, thiamine, allantoin-domain-containing protein n=1 Tax=Hypoxylon rubiginosum TaxID=110542 RepID=A0ACC0DG75_9PEZI|nr:permease for cytosine/purines, uracil, thiamine, allantoin-domain-containing protein [Hypoxylon rubiginosum]